MLVPTEAVPIMEEVETGEEPVPVGPDVADELP
jgi:hypothetical protein